jgi:hypothetical protein
MKRPVTVIILFILSIINGLQSTYNSLAFAGILPVRLFGGSYSFFNEGVSWIGIFMTATIAFFWFLTAWMLWTMKREAWRSLITISGLYLFAIFVLLLGQTSWQELIAPIISNVLVLILCALPSTRKALIPHSWGN